MEFGGTRFARRVVRRTGALELMEDLAGAAADAHMLGGGNPARIPEVESVYRRRLAEIAAEPSQFGRFAAGYSGPAGHIAFRAAVADALCSRYGWPVGERNVALTCGSQSAFLVLFNLLAGSTREGLRRILLPVAPEYIGYADVGLEDGLLVSCRAAVEDLPDGCFKYRMVRDELEKVDDVGAICVSRPTNPTGNVLSAGELAALDALARSRRVPLIVDAAYGLPFPGIQFTGTAPAWNDNMILCLSLSKLGLPGTRTGIVIADEAVIEAITSFTASAALAPASTGPEIVAPLLRSGELEALCSEVIRPYYQSRAAHAVAELRERCAGLPLRIHRPEGAFFLWLWFPGLPVTSEVLYRRLKSRGVIVLSGHHFFPGLDGDWAHRRECLRVSYAQRPESVSAGFAAIAEEVVRAFDESAR
jgi:valine--pyruvate aminotransferase